MLLRSLPKTMPVPVVCSFCCPPLDMTQFTYLPWLRGIWTVSVLGTDEHNYKHSHTGLWAEVFFHFSCIVGPCVSVCLSLKEAVGLFSKVGAVLYHRRQCTESHCSTALPALQISSDLNILNMSHFI